MAMDEQERRARDAERKRAARARKRAASADASADASAGRIGFTTLSAQGIDNGVTLADASSAEATVRNHVAHPGTFETLSDAVPYMTPEQKRALVARSLAADDLEHERRETELDRVRRERERAKWKDSKH